MKHRNLPVLGNLMHRSRIDTLLRTGLEYSVVTVITAPGYGKTQAVASFANQLDKRLAWMRFPPEMNNTFHFWNIFTEALVPEMPLLARRLREMDFPDSQAKVDHFLRTFASELYKGEQLVMVLDDYDHIGSPATRAFVRRLIDASLENLCIIILSNVKADLNVMALSGEKRLFSITTEDMRFSEKEAAEWFHFHGISMAPARMREILEETEGWPLALYLLIVRHNSGRSVDRSAESILPLSSELFEHQYFLNYDPSIQQLLVKLAFFSDFTFDVVRDIGGCDLAEAVQIISSHAFVFYNYDTKVCTFQKMYQSFLSQKSFLIPQAEINRIYNIAGDHCMASGDTFNAMICYERCGEYDKLVRSMAHAPGVRISRSLAEYMLECFDKIPDDYRERHLEVTFHCGLLVLNNGDIDKALSYFAPLAAQLENTAGRSAEENWLLGETYAVLADISLLLNTTDFYSYFQRANALLPQSSKIRNKNIMYIDNNSIFFLPNEGPGGFEEILKLISDGTVFIESISNGSGRGFEYLFAAEAFYAVGNLEKTRTNAFQAIYKARSTQQHDIICNAYFLLARVALAEGDGRQMTEHITNIRDYVNASNCTQLFDLRDCCDAWYYLMMNQPSQVPDWIVDPDNPRYTQLTITAGRNLLMHASYLIHVGKYPQCIAVLRALDDLSQQRRLWISRLIAHTMSAICHMAIGDTEGMLEEFDIAYRMSYHNNICMPFIDNGGYTVQILDKILAQKSHPYDAQWLQQVRKKAEVANGRHEAIVAVHSRETKKQPSAGLRPTDRELEVLRYLAQGLTRTEISGLMAISVNGVKKHITNIYNKLGAINRADAIHIAIENGFIE